MNIRILPPELASQIAAGEVVERPASAVKELLDNAVDAGAGTVRIEIEQGGSKRIRVVDDGSGMDREDAELAVERHSTSKIRSLEDLAAVTTLGFRGEALASIASVSRFALQTRTVDSVSGWRVSLVGGTDRKVEEIGAPVGTSVSVEDLFFNVPARRKFLKTESTELRHIVDAATKHALANEAVRYLLTHNGRSVLDYQSAPNRFDRTAAVFGKKVSEDLMAVTEETASATVEGFVSRPTYYRKSSDQIYFILNGRAIQSRLLISALMGGYEKCLPARHYPAAALYLTVDPHDVDVNVHPSKIEVKFANDSRIFSLVRSAVRAALMERSSASTHRGSGIDGRPAQQEGERERRGEREITPPSAPREDPMPPLRPAPPRGDRRRERIKRKIEEYVKRDSGTENRDSLGRTSSRPSTPSTPSRPSAASLQPPAFNLPEILTPLGQVMGAYILCRSSDGLIIVDMHAAHERIRYTALLREAAREHPTSEHLLFPHQAELSPVDVETLLEHRQPLAGIGFEIESFGGGTLSVSRIPTVLDLGAIDPILRDLATDLREHRGTASFNDLQNEILIRVACHSALRSGESIREEEMLALLEQIRGTPQGDTCPHGRPTWIRIGKGDLERLFKRSGF